MQHDGLLKSLSRITIALPGIARNSPNAELSWKEFSGGVVVDPVTGNYVPSNSIPVLVKAELQQAKDPQTQENPGLNRNRIYLTGYLHDPLIYKNPLPETMEAVIKYQGEWRKGKFFPLIIFNDSIGESINLDIALGQEIRGYFEIEEGY